MIKTIVLIDDDSDDLDILKEAISKVDPHTNIISFIYPEEAIRVVSDELVVFPEYFFIDINMPAIAGDKCIAELRKRSQFDESVITVLSTAMRKDVAEALKSIGANFAFQKPITMKSYYDIIETVLGSKNAFMENSR